MIRSFTSTALACSAFYLGKASCDSCCLPHRPCPTITEPGEPVPHLGGPQDVSPAILWAMLLLAGEAATTGGVIPARPLRELLWGDLRGSLCARAPEMPLDSAVPRSFPLFPCCSPTISGLGLLCVESCCSAREVRGVRPQQPLQRHPECCGSAQSPSGCTVLCTAGQLLRYHLGRTLSFAGFVCEVSTTEVPFLGAG